MRYPYGKSILITGASSGIGLAAELFARNGFTVYAASRRCEESVQGPIIGIRMDVCDEASVLRARDLIEARGGVGILARMARDEQNGAVPEKVAKTAFRLAQKSRPPVRTTVGAAYQLVMLLRRVLPARTCEFMLQRIYR